MPRKRQWKQYWLAEQDTFRELQSRWGSSSEAFGKDGRMLFEGGAASVTTNIADRDVRRLMAGARRHIPEPMWLHDDDEELRELLASRER